MEKMTKEPRKKVKAPKKMKAGDLRQHLSGASDEQKAWIERTLSSNPDGQTIFVDSGMFESLGKQTKSK